MPTFVNRTDVHIPNNTVICSHQNPVIVFSKRDCKRLTINRVLDTSKKLARGDSPDLSRFEAVRDKSIAFIVETNFCNNLGVVHRASLLKVNRVPQRYGSRKAQDCNMTTSAGDPPSFSTIV